MHKNKERARYRPKILIGQARLKQIDGARYCTSRLTNIDWGTDKVDSKICMGQGRLNIFHWGKAGLKIFSGE